VTKHKHCQKEARKSSLAGTLSGTVFMMEADPPLSEPQLPDYLEPFRVSVQQILTRVNKVLQFLLPNTSFNVSCFVLGFFSFSH